MRVTHLLGDGQIRFSEIPRPPIPSDHVLIEVAYCGACGSDNRLFSRGSPVVPGHEIVGTVKQLGPGTRRDLEGHRVAVYIPLMCGHCELCQSGNTQLCPHMAGLIGWQVPGGYSDAVVVPARNVIPLPEDIGFDEGVLLLDTLGTTGHAIRYLSRIVVDSPCDALVLGLGALGFGCILSLFHRGYRDIWGYDPSPIRRQTASEVLPVSVLNTPPDRSFSLIVEASGRFEARELALNLVKPGGAIALLGENDSPWTITPQPSLRRKDFAVARTFYFPLTEVSDTMNALRDLRPYLGPLLAVRRPLSDLAQTIAEFRDGRLLKPLIYPD